MIAQLLLGLVVLGLSLRASAELLGAPRAARAPGPARYCIERWDEQPEHQPLQDCRPASQFVIPAPSERIVPSGG